LLPNKLGSIVISGIDGSGSGIMGSVQSGSSANPFLTLRDSKTAREKLWKRSEKKIKSFKY